MPLFFLKLKEKSFKYSWIPIIRMHNNSNIRLIRTKSVSPEQSALCTLKIRPIIWIMITRTFDNCFPRLYFRPLIQTRRSKLIKNWILSNFWQYIFIISVKDFIVYQYKLLFLTSVAYTTFTGTCIPSPSPSLHCLSVTSTLLIASAKITKRKGSISPSNFYGQLPEY